MVELVPDLSLSFAKLAKTYEICPFDQATEVDVLEKKLKNISQKVANKSTKMFYKGVRIHDFPFK